MRALHALASTYGQRPSDIVGIRGRAAAYQFDLSVLLIALKPEGKSNSNDGAPMGDVRTLARGPIQRIKIPDDGIW